MPAGRQWRATLLPRAPLHAHELCGGSAVLRSAGRWWRRSGRVRDACRPRGGCRWSSCRVSRQQRQQFAFDLHDGRRLRIRLGAGSRRHLQRGPECQRHAAHLPSATASPGIPRCWRSRRGLSSSCFIRFVSSRSAALRADPQRRRSFRSQKAGHQALGSVSLKLDGEPRQRVDSACTASARDRQRIGDRSATNFRGAEQHAGGIWRHEAACSAARSAGPADADRARRYWLG